LKEAVEGSINVIIFQLAFVRLLKCTAWLLGLIDNS